MYTAPESRICRRCNKNLPLEKFQDNSSCSFGKTYSCKKCVAENTAKWHQENKEKRQRDATMRKQLGKIKAVVHFGDRCNKCGDSYPVCCYEFHHINGEKDGNPSKYFGLKEERMFAELEKCVMLCSNCHKTEHFGENMLKQQLKGINSWRESINKPTIKVEDLIKEGTVGGK